MKGRDSRQGRRPTSEWRSWRGFAKRLARALAAAGALRLGMKPPELGQGTQLDSSSWPTLSLEPDPIRGSGDPRCERGADV